MEPPLGTRDAALGDGVLTVSELVRAAHRCLEETFAYVCVEGEVTNLRITASGHAFLTLRDSESALPAAIWRSTLARLPFRLKDGQSCRMVGRLGIYLPQGRFQLYVERVEPAGLGELLVRLERIKARLAAEGLFAAERRRPLPSWPRIVGIVTSPTGAALHDILKVARRRCPTHIVLSPARVQGEGAAASLVAALARIAGVPGVDVVILGRGGGSLEDLWAFNDENLARAVAACPVAVVSAVGHETDLTICDLVADLRAATPSQAAELVVPDEAAFRRAMDAIRRRLVLACRRRVIDERARYEQRVQRLERVASRISADARDRLGRLHRALLARHPSTRIRGERSRLARAKATLSRQGKTLVHPARIRIARAASALAALSPLAALGRGYALILDREGRVVRDAAMVAVGAEIDVRLGRGRLAAEVRRVTVGDGNG